MSTSADKSLSDRGASELRIAAVNLHSVPGDKAGNLARIEEWTLKAARSGARLVCFPALAVSGWWETSEAAAVAEIVLEDTSNPSLVHPRGDSIRRLEKLAEQTGLYIAAGLVEDSDYYHLRNTICLTGPEGLIGAAAQIHTPHGEHPTFVSARGCRVFELAGTQVGIIVGDDLLYPEVARLLVLQGAQVLIAALATRLPDQEDACRRWIERLERLAAVRAIENGVPVIALEPSGRVHNPVEKTGGRFPGFFAAFDADGRPISKSIDGNENLAMASILPQREPSPLIGRRRPEVYAILAHEQRPQDRPGTRQADWDAQGEILWSRLRDAGFFAADLHTAEALVPPRRPALIATGASLPPLDNYRAVVLTRPCLASLSAEAAARLPAWVQRGGVLVLDGYCGRNASVLAPLAGLSGAELNRELFLPSCQDASRPSARVAFRDSAVVTGMDVRFRPKVWGQAWLAGVPGAAEVLADLYAPSGEPLGPIAFRHSVGAGHVYTFGYSLGYSQLLLMQGRGTTRDLGSFPPRIAPGVPRDGDVTMWGDQVVTDSDDQYFPAADYHLIPLLNILLEATGCPALISCVPGGAECGVIFTGDSDRANTAQVNRYTAMLTAHGIRPTQFLLRGGYSSTELDPACEYGIHPIFHETEAACFAQIVKYGFSPEQLVSGRRHCLVQFGLTDTLERMAACGIRYTSNNWDFPYPETHSAAFLFGTTLPHHVYNWQGRRIGIVDIPQVFMDYPPFMESSEASYRDVRRTHGVAAWNFHPQNLVMPKVVETIEALARRVRADGVWCGTMREYGDWYLQREQIQLVIQPDGGIAVDLKALPEVTILTSQRTMHINGAQSRAGRSSTWYGREYWAHTVTARPAVVSSLSKAR